MMMMSPDERRRVKFGPFSTWQWAVIGSYVIAIVLSAYVGAIANRGDDNARAGNVAICVEIGFLKNSDVQTQRAIEKAERITLPDPDRNRAEYDKTVRLILERPKDQFTPDRLASLANLRGLINKLEKAIPSCRRALRSL
jgi:hypothetical protein